MSEPSDEAARSTAHDAPPTQSPARLSERSPLLSRPEHSTQSRGSGQSAAPPSYGYPAAMAMSMDVGTARSAGGRNDEAHPRLHAQRNVQSDQERADLEYARRLAAEEELLYAGGRGVHGGGPIAGGPGAGFGGVFVSGGSGVAGARNYAAGGAAGGGGVGAGQAQREQVRNAMMGELLTQRRFTQISFWLLLIVNLPQVALIVFYSIRNAHKFNSCDRPLNLWLIIHGCRLVMTTGVAALPLVSPRRWAAQGERFQRVNESTNLLAFITFILGNFWLFDSQTCRDINPEVFKLTFWLIVLQYCFMMLPCVLLLCLAPAVFCCLPLLIRMSLILPAGVGLRMLDQQGASQDLIAKLPPATKFKRGMFGGSAAEAAPPRPASAATAEEKTGAAERTSPSTNHDEPECAICLSNYTVGEFVRQLPCQGGHHFHQKCVDDWLKIHATCPCCRESLLPLMSDANRMRERIEAMNRPHPAAAAAPSRPQPAVVRASPGGDESSSLLLSQRNTQSGSAAAADDDADASGSSAPSTREGSRRNSLDAGAALGSATATDDGKHEVAIRIEK